MPTNRPRPASLKFLGTVGAWLVLAVVAVALSGCRASVRSSGDDDVHLTVTTPGTHGVSFAFENSTARPIAIANIQKTCVCHNPTLWPQQIPAGGRGVISFDVVVSYRARVTGALRVTWDDGQVSDLQFSVEMPRGKAVDVSPQLIRRSALDDRLFLPLTVIADFYGSEMPPLPSVEATVAGRSVITRIEKVHHMAKDMAGYDIVVATDALKAMPRGAPVELHITVPGLCPAKLVID